MKNSLRITIPMPCHEKWEEMTPTEQGAYCKACQKNVIDFTRKTQNEIYDIVSNAKGETCGRFFATQIQEPIVRTELNPSWFNWRAIAASLAALVAGEKSFGNNPYMEDSAITVTNQFTITERDSIDLGDSLLTITGRVLDSATTEPLMGAVVLLHNAQIGAVADAEGFFVIKTSTQEMHKSGYKLNVSYVGYVEQLIKVNPSSPANIQVYLSAKIQEELIVVVSGRYTSTSCGPAHSKENVRFTDVSKSAISLKLRRQLNKLRKASKD